MGDSDVKSGIVPVKSLDDKSKTLSAEELPMVGGTGPEKAFPDAVKRSRFDMSPIVPLKSLSSSMISLNRLESNRDDGNSPVIELEDKFKP
jgi:hypothetical protein